MSDPSPSHPPNASGDSGGKDLTHVGYYMIGYSVRRGLYPVRLKDGSPKTFEEAKRAHVDLTGRPGRGTRCEG